MTGDEDQAEQIVADVIVDRRVEFRHGLSCCGLEFAAELLVLALEQFVSAQAVDGAMFCGRHEPGARFVRHARLRPLFERGNESILRQFLGQADVAHDPREPAMSRADSILQTASIARCVSVAVTATDHTIFRPAFASDPS